MLWKNKKNGILSGYFLSAGDKNKGKLEELFQ